MVALPLFDVVVSSGKGPGGSGSNRAALLAAQLVESALSEVRQIEKIDESVAPDDPLEFDRQTAMMIRGMYEEWVSQAQRLLDRIRTVEGLAEKIPDSLRNTIGRIRAMLSVPIDHMEESRRQAKDGRLIPVENIRRELRAKIH